MTTEPTPYDLFGGADFFRGHAMLQSTLLARSAAAVLALCDGVDAVARGDVPSGVVALGADLAHMDAVFAAQRAGETGRWAGLYLYDKL